MTYAIYTQRDKMFVNINFGQRGWHMIEIPSVNRAVILYRLKRYLSHYNAHQKYRECLGTGTNIDVWLRDIIKECSPIY